MEQTQTQEQQTSYPVELNSMQMTSYFLTEALSTGTTLEQLKLYCKYPMKYNKQLRKISREMYGLNGVCANVVDYYKSSPSLDFITICNNFSPANIKKKKLYDSMIYKINHKLTSRDIILHLLLDGFYVGYLRNTKGKKSNTQIQDAYVDSLDTLEGLSMDDSIMIQPLNLDYCKIIGYQNNDFVAAFDLMYFNQFVGNGLLGEIKNYPSEFAKAYVQYKKDGSKRWFPLDQSKTVTLKFKSNINEAYGRPLAIAALCDIFFSDQYDESQRANIIENSGTIRYMRQPEGEVSGTCALSPEAQQNQYTNFKNAVLSNTSGVSSRIGKTTVLVVAPGTELGKLDNATVDGTKTLTKENTTKVSTGLGFAAGALNGEGDSTYSSLEVNLDLILTQVFEILEQVSWQYTKVFANFIKLKGEDFIKFTYLKTSTLNRKKEYDIAKEMFTLVGGSRLWLYAVGSGDVNLYMDLMDYEKAMGFDEKYGAHMTAFTNSGSQDNKNGRPPTEDIKNENTEKSKTNNNSNVPKPSTK